MKLKGKGIKQGQSQPGFQKGQHCSVITCAFASQENEIKELCECSV